MRDLYDKMYLKKHEAHTNVGSVSKIVKNTEDEIEKRM